MQFTETRIPGAWIIDVAPVEDERGLFATTWLPEAFAARGLDPSLAQCNLAFSRRRGTLRGLHFQRAPHEQVKIVRCTRGALVDVIVDLRPDSSAYRTWASVELSADNRRMLYVPAGLAHGYLTLADDTEAYYHASKKWAPGHEWGVRWNDPAFGIEWPFEPTVISDKDRTWPLLGP
jgi:dTDP-4-dehydrorhamnose 3,5-epimerase